jgi:DNA-binding IclR family transcriptional regulator
MILSSVKKTFKVLEIFTPNQPELGVTEINRLLGVDKSSISRILITLTSAGFLERNSLNRKYRLGWKLVDLGNRVMSRYYNVRDYASPFMEELGKRINEIIHLSILDRNEIVYLEKKGEGQTLTVATKIGGRNPAHASAMGKVLLSGLSQDELAEILTHSPLQRFTSTTITEIPKLLKELEKVRKQGFAIDNEESFAGIRCVAAPIKDDKGKIIAAISATVPKQRMTKQRMVEIKKHIIGTVSLISNQIKYTE